MAWLRTSLKESQLTWPGDPTWPWAKNFTECSQWMSVKSQKVSVLFLQLFGNDTRKTWGGLRSPTPRQQGLRDTNKAIRLLCDRIGRLPFTLNFLGAGLNTNTGTRLSALYSSPAFAGRRRWFRIWRIISEHLSRCYLIFFWKYTRRSTDFFLRNM